MPPESLRAAVALGLVLCAGVGCKQKPADTQARPAAQQVEKSAELPKPLVQTVLTSEERQTLTPDRIVRGLREGNERFVSGTLTVRDHSAQVRASVGSQFPKAAFLSCLDSRIPIEDVFDRGIGDVFVARVAGNFENTDILGSLEFATKVAGAKVILVLGHGDCGAIQAAIDGVELGNITPMLSNIQPAVAHFAEYAGEKSSNNTEFLKMVTEQNVRMTMSDIRSRSPIIQELADAGEVRIIGGVYYMDSGRVHFIE